jgi:CDGSH-type Zn-finger protein
MSHIDDREMQGTTVRVVVVPDGPYQLTGPLEIGSPHGTIESPAAQLYLCRCGRSANKPFCDGSHARTGWKEDA